MKRIIISLIVLFTALCVSAASPEEFWNRANEAYINGKYEEAVVLYDSIAQGGYIGGELYYNLGNAHFKLGHLGKAILNYRRALKLEPHNADFRYNLAVAESRTKDKVEALPTFAMSATIELWRSYLTTNEWAIISLVMFATSLAGVLVYLLSRGKRYRRAGFWVAVSVGVLCFISLWFAIAQRQKFSKKEGVVLVSATSVSSSPEGSGREIFILHEGTVVSINGDYGTWVEIVLPDGNKGWMQHSALEEIGS